MSKVGSMRTHTLPLSTYTLSSVNVEARGHRMHSAVWARYPDFEPDTDLVLVRRGPGSRFLYSDVQWAILRHNHGYNESAREWWSAENLVGLYEKVSEVSRENNRYVQRVDDWLRGFALSLFDQSDPAEAADALMFALGAPLVTPPRAAL